MSATWPSRMSVRSGPSMGTVFAEMPCVNSKTTSARNPAMDRNGPRVPVIVSSTPVLQAARPSSIGNALLPSRFSEAVEALALELAVDRFRLRAIRAAARDLVQVERLREEVFKAITAGRRTFGARGHSHGLRARLGPLVGRLRHRGSLLPPRGSRERPVGRSRVTVGRGPTLGGTPRPLSGGQGPGAAGRRGGGPLGPPSGRPGPATQGRWQGSLHGGRGGRSRLGPGLRSCGPLRRRGRGRGRGRGHGRG